jgi:lipase maturation factor 1
VERSQKPPAPSFATGARLFVCVLAITHAVAFASIWIQADGLIGPAGILPAGEYFSLVRDQLGRHAWFDVPSLCWIFGAGAFVKVLCAVGIGLSVLLFLGYAPALCLALLWGSYLSLVSAGQVFFDFQWDLLLLESTLLGIFIVPWTLRPTQARYDPPKLARYLVWWLIFRLMFLSGVVKLTSGDVTWRHLTALTFHYETQPLPSPVAWYMHQLPVWFQEASCVVMFVIELGAPLLLLAPRRLRHWAATALIALQVVIAATGNYAYFNLLSIGLCLTCLDDEWWINRHWGVPQAPAASIRFGNNPRRFKATAVRWFAAISVGVTFFETVASLSPGSANSPIVRAVEEAVGPLQSFNTYGLFRVMTIERPELIIEGSDDGRDWLEYALPYKPGDLGRRPSWVAPYQPRLDWQLWFAALAPPDSQPWVGRLCELLLKGDPGVLGLFYRNPFPSHPPHYMRVVRYRYEFTDRGERTRTGNWWHRTPLDFYISPVALSSDPK